MSRIPLRFEISRNPFFLRNGRLTIFAPDHSNGPLNNWDRPRLSESYLVRFSNAA
jgi:hypothetical protein